jgi:hypothetical protein
MEPKATARAWSGSPSGASQALQDKAEQLSPRNGQLDGLALGLREKVEIDVPRCLCERSGG